jgi:excisionase family DNA binding protein
MKTERRTTVLESGTGSVPTSLDPAASSRMSVEEVARRLNVGRLTVYAMLEQGIIPGVRIGRRWIITRHAYEHWEQTCGLRSESGLSANPEVMVLN